MQPLSNHLPIRCRSCYPGALAEPDRLATLASTGLLDSPAEEAFDRPTRMLRRLLQVPVALVSLVDAHRQFFKSEAGLTEPWKSRRESPLSHSFCQWIVVEGRPLVIADARLDERLKHNPAVEELGVIAYAGFPLATRDGMVLGSLCVLDSTPRTWNDHELETLSGLSHAVSTEIDLRLEVAARESTQRQLAQSLAGLKENNRLLEAFTQIASHDLKGPLRSIVGTLSALEMVLDPTGSEQAELLACALDCARRQLGLIESLAFYAGLKGKPPRRGWFELDPLLDHIARSLDVRCRELGVRLEISWLGRVWGDSYRLEQLFRNLIENALKFRRPGAGSLVRVGRQNEDYLVADNGIGMDPRHLATIFEPFKRLHTASEYAGSGLGLAICKTVVEEHGGSIWAESAPGVGTTVRFRLGRVA